MPTPTTTRIEPRVKQQIKKALEEAMYAPTKRRNEARLKEILATNTTASRYDHESFSYKGVYYSFELTTPRFKTNRLLPELHASMDAYLADQRELEFTEKPFILGLFNKMLNASNSVLDYKAMLPECLQRTIDAEIAQLPPEIVYPREMTDEQVEAFKQEHAHWILMLKKRMVLDLVL